MSKDQSIIKYASVEKTLEENLQKFVVELETGFSEEELRWLQLVDRLAEFEIFEPVDEVIKVAVSNALMDLITRARQFVPNAQALARKPISEARIAASTKKVGRQKQISSSTEEENEE